MAKCKFCTLYNDAKKCCKLNLENHTRDEEHHCLHNDDGNANIFSSTVNSLRNSVQWLNLAKSWAERSSNTEYSVEKILELSDLIETVKELADEIESNPDKFCFIPENLGTCENCAHRKQDTPMPDGHFCYGTCKYGPPCHSGYIKEYSWRGCAKWRPVGQQR